MQFITSTGNNKPHKFFLFEKLVGPFFVLLALFPTWTGFILPGLLSDILSSFFIKSDPTDDVLNQYVQNAQSLTNVGLVASIVILIVFFLLALRAYVWKKNSNVGPLHFLVVRMTVYLMVALFYVLLLINSSQIYAI